MTSTSEQHTAGEQSPAATERSAPAPSHRDRRLVQAFRDALQQLEQAPPFARERYQTELFARAGDLLKTGPGLRALLDEAHRYDAAGVFHNGPWAEPEKLVPELVGGGLLGEGLYPIVETLSELRMLAIAGGRCTHAKVTPRQAIQFLRDAVIANLDLLFGDASEASRERPEVYQRAHRLLNLIAEQIPMTGLRDEVVAEIGFIQAQRPILTRRSVDLIEYALRLPDQGTSEAANERLETYRKAIGRPGRLSQKAEDPVTYRQLLRQAGEAQLQDECVAFAYTLQETGLSNPWHAVLLRYLSRRYHEFIAACLGVNDYGIASLNEHEDEAIELLRFAIVPATHASIYGFAGLLVRGLLNRPAVVGGLRRLVDLDVHPEVKRMLLETVPQGQGLTANMVLVAGMFSVLGQPLGIGQGHNPTCQAARGISLWSRHAPDYLLEIVSTAARDNLVEIDFEGVRLNSAELAGGVAGGDIDPRLDAISRLLVPHLDRLYDEFMRRAAMRGEDGHKWVNRALYGRMIPPGFASAIDPLGNTVSGYEDFIRLFYASHHPDYNDEHELIYPNPVGLLITDINGNLLGPHAVSILRVDRDDRRQYRIYFFNPNNEGRQNWGQGIRPAVSGHGEEHGESSLSFEQFAARLYAFHYNPYETGDAFAVDATLISDIEKLARNSWGRSYTWL